MLPTELTSKLRHKAVLLALLQEEDCYFAQISFDNKTCEILYFDLPEIKIKSNLKYYLHKAGKAAYVDFDGQMHRLS